MLTIRAAQIHALQADLLKEWIAEILQREEAPALSGRTPAQVEAMVTEGIERGRAYGLTLPGDLLAYTRVLVLLGPDWQQGPDAEWAGEFLDDWDPDLGARVLRLEQAVRARQARQPSA